MPPTSTAVSVLALVLAACGPKTTAETPSPSPAEPAPSAPEPAVEEPAMAEPITERIEETTVGDLDGARVAVGTIVLSGTYPLPDGTEGEGVAAVLALPDGTDAWVGAGSEVTVEGIRWKIVAVDKESGEPGEVTLERLGPAD